MLPSEVFPEKPRRRRGKPEKKVQKEIACWLLSRGVIAVVTDAGVLYGMSCGIPPGWPDLTGIMPGGRFVGVECKAAKGRQSEDQKEVQRIIGRLGGLYILAHSLDELKAELRKENLLNPINFPVD
jgi:hypothetical protein